jgi:pimeloyl-ACP methyl ester carboxylesterase
MPMTTGKPPSLYYEQAGTGERPFVFVHGWCCDRTFFAPQFDHFKVSHPVTTFDLRGCGMSDQPEGGYDIPTLADDVASLCDELGISEPIVVGHSLGGMIGIELAARYPSLPAAIVAVDPGPIDPLPEATSAFEGLVAQLEDPDGVDPRRAYIEGMFRPTDDAERARSITETMCAVPASVAAAVLRGVLSWQGVEALRLCNVPLLVLLSSTGGRSNDPERLLPLKPGIEFGVTVGAGHFHQLDAPEQVTPMIERFVRLRVGDGTPI